jgi:hypothetical protein
VVTGIIRVKLLPNGHLSIAWSEQCVARQRLKEWLQPFFVLGQDDQEIIIINK